MRPPSVMNETPRKRGSLSLCLLGMTILANVAIGQGGGGEAGLWHLWTAHLSHPGQHQRHADAMAAYAARRPPEPLAPVAQTIQAWHLLKMGNREDAQRILEPLSNLASTEGVQRGAREIARAWLSALDREVLVRGLAEYRVRHVRYPDRLETLESWDGLSLSPRFTDRWDNRWDYRVERLRSMPSLPGQRYRLQSRTLGDPSDLESLLKMPYAARHTLKPVQIRAVPGRPAMVALRSEDAEAGSATATVMTGSSHEGITVAYASRDLVILRDRLHWKLFLNPERTSR